MHCQTKFKAISFGTGSQMDHGPFRPYTRDSVHVSTRWLCVRYLFGKTPGDRNPFEKKLPLAIRKWCCTLIGEPYAGKPPVRFGERESEPNAACLPPSLEGMLVDRLSPIDRSYVTCLPEGATGRRKIAKVEVKASQVALNMEKFRTDFLRATSVRLMEQGLYSALIEAGFFSHRSDYWVLDCSHFSPIAFLMDDAFHFCSYPFDRKTGSSALLY